MSKTIIAAGLLAVAFPAAAAAQMLPTRAVTGTRLDIQAVGEVTRTPDVARISAGVVTQSASATEALSANGQRMNRVLAALKRAGVADRDVQTSAIQLSPEYRYVENQPPVITGYRASNEVTIRFRDIRQSGAILDTLVREGANQINGPQLLVDKPETGLDEARVAAMRQARTRADLYARAAGLRVARILSISEQSGNYYPPPPQAMRMEMAADAAQTKIAPGEQTLQVTVQVSFELE